ncbi:MAG: hypothetical protein KUG77_19435 [Nannocystaceae bacterium]|nr:hypothetical protein [Nannocystaceae bacterium]
MKRTATALVCLMSACTLTPENGVFGAGEGPSERPTVSETPGSTGQGAETPSGESNDDGDSSGGTTGEWTGASPDATADGPADTDPGSTGQFDSGDVENCASDTLEGGLAGSTLGRSNETSGSCGGGAAPEHAFVFTASEDGLYTFDTNGSDFDTVLYVLGGAECGAPELACDDDGGDSAQSEVTLPLDAGQSVTVVVDGYSSESGAFVLGVAEETANSCGAQALAGGLPLSVQDTTAGASAYQGSCGGSGAPERAFSWTAPQAGTYTIHTTGSDFDTVLYVRDGSCIGPELECDDDGGPNTQSSLTLDLQAGQDIVIFADGYNSNAGNISLTIES